ncbi:MAG: hypothetical protein JRN20_19390 [Nitrososphaerota archaeon]|nr:hypothetical protein [Nitrososphaerota archaeon]MDG6922741.1 hypothetical protein [Nitrososphaerota archaeon]
MMEKSTFETGDTFGKWFIMVSLIYFIIGTLWMGPLGIMLPGPSGEAGTVYDTAHWHVVFVGFIAFFVLGSLYYIAPRLGGRTLYSRRLGLIHFWASNILFPLAVLLFAWVSIAYQTVLNSPNFSPSALPAGLMTIYLLVLIIMFVGIGFQGVLAYNIFMTVRKKPTT